MASNSDVQLSSSRSLTMSSVLLLRVLNMLLRQEAQ